MTTSGSMRLNVTRMDSKGRISIPMAVRHYMRLSQGDELMLSAQANELRLMPVGTGNTELNIRFKKFTNVSDALCRIMRVLSGRKITIISSEVQMIDGHAGWRAVLDVSDYKKLKSEIAGLNSVKELSIRKN